VTVEPDDVEGLATRVDAPALAATTAAEDAAWYVVSTKPRREEFAATQLAQRAIDVFLPRIVLSRRGESLVRPLFPGYLFAHIALHEHGARVTWTPGVRRLVTFDDEPPPVPDSAIEFLRSQIGAGGLIVARPRPLPVGRRVRVTNGPLSGLVGIIEDPPDARGRVRVLMDILRRQTRVSVDAQWLEDA
jgi:transcriptional antiterminator RfaH